MHPFKICPAIDGLFENVNSEISSLTFQQLTDFAQQMLNFHDPDRLQPSSLQIQDLPSNCIFHIPWIILRFSAHFLDFAQHPARKKRFVILQR